MKFNKKFLNNQLLMHDLAAKLPWLISQQHLRDLSPRTKPHDN